MHLPTTLRPRDSSYRKFTPGIDLPSWFLDDLKSLDSKLYLVWHPFRVLWDDMINQYEGLLEDPRFTIHQEYGVENWGFILSDGKGTPFPDCSWHVWRLCEPYGWAHVVKIEDKHPAYLNLLVKRLALQARFRDKYGDLAWNRRTQTEQTEAQAKALEDKQEMFGAVQEENKWLMKTAMENMNRRVVKPTNPEISKIISYPNQTKHTATSRPLLDEDVGLVGMDDD